MKGFLVSAPALSIASTGSIMPHVLVTIHEFEAEELLILHQVSFMFNYMNMTTHSHKSLN